MAGSALLATLLSFTVLALAGYASFGRHPSLVASVPGAAQWYGIALRVIPIAHVWLAFAVLACYLTLHTGARWLASFGLLYALSLSSELLGTGYGIPFGAYHYSTLLGPEWMHRVPILIPLSWFSMSLSSYALVLRGSARGSITAPRRRKAILLASLLLLCWDLSLDPAMSHATMFWVWGSHGPYYGMPWSNIAGWYITGIVLTSVLAWTGADRWIELLSTRWLAGFYGANLLLALGMCVAAGLWLGTITTLVAIVATGAALSLSSRVPVKREHAEGPDGHDGHAGTVTTSW